LFDGRHRVGWTSRVVFGEGGVLSHGHEQTLETIREIADRVASELALEIVEVELRGAGRRSHLRVFIDRPGTDGVGIDECRRLSEALGAALDEADPIANSYTLEVSSPGLDRPIRTADDIRRNTGRRILVETTVPLGGRRSFRGILMGQEQGDLKLREEDGEEVRIPLGNLRESRQDPAF